MRKGDHGRRAVPPGRDTYAVGDRVVCNGVFGSVVSVDPDRGTVGIKWGDGAYYVVWSENALGMRRAFPWEN
jgi:hypothetical protein